MTVLVQRCANSITLPSGSDFTWKLNQVIEHIYHMTATLNPLFSWAIGTCLCSSNPNGNTTTKTTRLRLHHALT